MQSPLVKSQNKFIFTKKNIMKCSNCKTPVFNTILHRTEPIGDDPNWMCMQCIEKLHPELADNIKNDDDYNIIQDIHKAAKS